jgi:hypothetical protein
MGSFFPLQFLNCLHTNWSTQIETINEQVILKVFIPIDHKFHIRLDTLHEISNKKIQIIITFWQTKMSMPKP